MSSNPSKFEHDVADSEISSPLQTGLICLDDQKENLVLVHFNLADEVIGGHEALSLTGLTKYFLFGLIEPQELYLYFIIYKYPPKLAVLLDELLKLRSVAPWAGFDTLSQLTAHYRRNPARLVCEWDDATYKIERAHKLSLQANSPELAGLENHLTGLVRLTHWLMQSPWPELVLPSMCSREKAWKAWPLILPALKVWAHAGLNHRLSVWKLAALKALREIHFHERFTMSRTDRKFYRSKLKYLLTDTHPQVRLEALMLYPKFSAKPLSQAICEHLVQDTDPRIVSRVGKLKDRKREFQDDDDWDWPGLAKEREQFVSCLMPEKQVEARIAWRLCLEVPFDGEKSWGEEIEEAAGSASFHFMFAQMRLNELLHRPPIISDRFGKRLSRAYAHARSQEEQVAVLRWIRQLELPEARQLLIKVFRHEIGYLRYIAAVFLGQQGFREVLPYLQSLDMEFWNRETVKALFVLQDETRALLHLEWLLTTEQTVLSNHPLEENVEPYEDGLLAIAELNWAGGIQLVEQLVVQGLMLGKKFVAWEQDQQIYHSPHSTLINPQNEVM